ncbi:hypothetical protein PYW08_016292 [Mythimna loreyi]|uniref:Uncharacterized protein n=1 Tax=Mythimna loreyi TaxID=667449 RepID=A0ACC2QYZ0_9NEOP|nr:hypothetical protein PYW08_016292 [Mythimna loreyi]
MSGDGERASRPSSLVLEAPPPEREALHFDVQLVGAPPEVEQLVNNIKQVAEDFLYHWKTFPIVLPPSRFSGPGNRPSDIIVAPPCDELDAAALDAGVEPHPLSPKQLHAIREKGEFEVPSRHFPGQTHVWRVAGWLQRGRARAREELYCHVARALALIVVVARDRLLRDEPLSVIAGAKSLLQGLHRLLDLAFGMPSLEARDLDKKIREERSRYLVAELICKPEHQEDIAALAAWVTRAMRRAAAEKTDAREPPRPAPPVPCLYTTPQRTQVDLRLYRRELVRRAASTLQAILEREARGWFLHFRERRAAQLASQKMPMKDIEQEVREAAMREYVSRVCTAVLGSEPLRALGPDVPALLAAQLRASAIVARAEEGVRRKLEAGLATAEARICASHPILSRAGAWRRERLAGAARRLAAELRWAPLEDAAAAMQAHKLHQHRYFLLRDLAFLRDREPLLMKELRSAVSPTRSFTWSRRIWRPAAWVVERHFRGRRERVPTVLSRRATSIVTPRSDPSQPVFLLHRDTAATTTTRWPAWRLLNLAHRTWCWCWNIMFVLGVLVPWCSPLSLRTLLCVKPFVPDYELSQVCNVVLNIMFVLGVLVPWCSPLSLRTLLCVKPFVPDYELSQVCNVVLNIMFVLGVLVPWCSPLSLRTLLCVKPFVPDYELSQVCNVVLNIMFVLGVLVPWCSPLSLRTLLCVKPFVPDYELSQVNGTLFPKRSSETQTMWSRLLTLWRHVSKERTRFETEPDTGLLGKGLSRMAHRVWTYGVVGGLGSLLLLLGLPLLVLLASVACAAAALSAPLWAPPLALATHLTNALLYDIDCPDPDHLNRWFVLLEVVVWRVGVLGALQACGALLCALLLCPLAAALLLIGGVSWWALRGLWEAAAWRGVLARGARVPAHDSAFCRRVRGPGLHATTYYQITSVPLKYLTTMEACDFVNARLHLCGGLGSRSGQALAAVMARAELEALGAWLSERERAVERPLRDYEQFVHACFGPFSVQIAKTGAYKQLEKECAALTASLREKASARRRELALGLSDAARARVRLTSHDLRVHTHISH